MTERPPDQGLEERVVRALIASGDLRPYRAWHPRALWAAGGLAAAVVLALVLARSPSSPQRSAEYVLLLHNTATYQWPPSGHLDERRAEYGRWADSLDRRGQLRIEGRLDGPGAQEPSAEVPGEINGLFIIRARNRAEADSIAAASPHVRYGGTVEVRQFVE